MAWLISFCFKKEFPSCINWEDFWWARATDFCITAGLGSWVLGEGTSNSVVFVDGVSCLCPHALPETTNKVNKNKRNKNLIFVRAFPGGVFFVTSLPLLPAHELFYRDKSQRYGRRSSRCRWRNCLMALFFVGRCRDECFVALKSARRLFH